MTTLASANPSRADDAGPEIRRIGMEDLKASLSEGLADFLQKPSHTFFLVMLYPVAGLALTYASSGADLFPLLFPLVAGFALVGPVALVLSAPFDMALALAYAALAMAFLNTPTGVTRALSATGRLSLTNYLMTSVILSAFFAHWGLGLFGDVTRWQAFALGLAPVAAMLLWSPPWVAKIGQGPFERLWRTGARALSYPRKA